MSKANQTVSGHLGAFKGFSDTPKCCMEGSVNPVSDVKNVCTDWDNIL